MEQNLLKPEEDAKRSDIVAQNKNKEQVLKLRGANLQFQSVRADQETTVSDACLDVISLHTIALLRHNREVRALITSLQESKPSKKEQSVIAEAPEIPELPECILKYRRPGDLASRPKDNRDSEEFNSFVAPVLPHNIAWKMLKKSVAVVCAHAGYDTTSDIILDTLTDIVQDYFKRVCLILQKNAEKGALMGHTGLVGVLEQTFHDIGWGSMTILHHFYQSRIIDYHEHVLKSCEVLMREYKKLKLIKEGSTNEKAKESPPRSSSPNGDDACASVHSFDRDNSNSIFGDGDDTQLITHRIGMEDTSKTKKRRT